jgi:transposase
MNSTRQRLGCIAENWQNGLVLCSPHRSAKIEPLRAKPSLAGNGEVAAATILIEMPEFGTLQKKKAANLTGLAPMTRHSGKWSGKATIQGGRKQLRDALYSKQRQRVPRAAAQLRLWS